MSWAESSEISVLAAPMDVVSGVPAWVIAANSRPRDRCSTPRPVTSMTTISAYTFSTGRAKPADDRDTAAVPDRDVAAVVQLGRAEGEHARHLLAVGVAGHLGVEDQGGVAAGGDHHDGPGRAEVLRPAGQLDVDLARAQHRVRQQLGHRADMRENLPNG